MHFELWWPLAFVLGLGAMRMVQTIVVSFIERDKQSAPRDLRELTEKVDRLSQAVEATALEVERIGESQRFLTRVLSDKAPEQIGQR